GTVTVLGLYEWNSGTMQGTGITEVQGGLALTGNVTMNRTLNLAGSSEIQGDFSMDGSGTLINAGTLTKTAGLGTATISPAFTNTGTVNINSGTLALAGGGSSAGTLQV